MPFYLQEAWERTWQAFYHPATSLFYDCLTANGLDDLPSADEIARQYPNPCGWGTGMEDCMLSAGAVMDILCFRSAAGDPLAAKQAEDVLKGLVLASTCHGKPGFFARSVSPFDGRSCYIDSSRDQFTLAVYALWRCFKNFPECRDTARELLVNTARYCEQVITPEGNGNLLRLDGRPGVFSTVWHAAPHEMLRLPMFYAAAWEASGDGHWQELALQYALPGIEATLKMNEADLWWWDITVSQMQISLAVLSAIPIGDTLLHKKYCQAMQMTTAHALKLFRKELEEAEAFTGDWTTPAPDWRNCPMRLLQPPHTPAKDGVLEGFIYANPRRPEEFQQVMDHTRSLGNLLFTLTLDQEAVPDADMLPRYRKLLEKMDFKNMNVNGILQLQQGLWSAVNRHWTE